MEPPVIFTGFFIVFIVLLLCALAFIAWIFVALIKSAHGRAREIDWFKRYGTRVLATVIEVKEQEESETVSKIGGKLGETETEWHTYYYIIAQYLDPYTKQIYTFQSDRLLNRPEFYKPGSTVLVVFNPQDPSRYFMDLLAIP